MPHQDWVCTPVDSYLDLINVLENLPKWHELCSKLTPHSKQLIRNIDLNNETGEEISLDKPLPFCHADLDTPDVPRHSEGTLPKTLLCHDMANGYHDDSLVEGAPHHEEYTFYHWAGIDIFCYFSHHLITIPPVGWINVAHAHGVKVLGTIITEWAEGQTFWDYILDPSEPDHVDIFVEMLVEVAQVFKFEGWLLNIENKTHHPVQLLEFVRRLHAHLHARVEHATLIWYDAVTAEGHLSWQNALTAKNKQFFDVCDGIFTNYSWMPEDLKATAVLAGSRLHDVYVGIDVWGRNFHGGGQFNTREAVSVVYEHGLSLAIFAPAWTYEGMTDTRQPTNNQFRHRSTIGFANDMSHFRKCLLRDRALWDSIWPFLNTRVPSQLPFHTSFCRGLGLKRRRFGEVISPSSWFNLRHMQYQPNAAHGPHTYRISTNTAEQVYGPAKRKRSIVESDSDKPAEKEVAGTNDKSDVTLTNDRSDVAVTNDKSDNEIDGEKSPSHPDGQPAETVTTMSSSHDEIEKRTFMIKFIDVIRNVQTYFNKSDQRAQRGDRQAGTSRAPPEAVAEELAADDTDNSDRIQLQKSTGKSMQQMSVRIKLGREMTYYRLEYIEAERDCLEYYMKDSFIGGSCLKINPTDEETGTYRTPRLMFCDFTCNKVLLACVVTKKMTGFENQRLNIVLCGNTASGRLTVSLEDTDSPRRQRPADPSKRERRSTMVKGMGSESMYFMPMETRPRKANSLLTGRVTPTEVPAWRPGRRLQPLAPHSAGLKPLLDQLLLSDSDLYVPSANVYGWSIRYYVVDLPGFNIQSIICRPELATGPVLLGHLCLYPVDLFSTSDSDE